MWLDREKNAKKDAQLKKYAKNRKEAPKAAKKQQRSSKEAKKQRSTPCYHPTTSCRTFSAE